MNSQQIKPNYILIPLITLIVGGLGVVFNNLGMTWYNTVLIKPALTPPKWVFPLAWNLIFVFATASALILWNTLPHKLNNFQKLFTFLFKKTQQKIEDFKTIFWLFTANAILNAAWSFLFFTNQWIIAALIEMILLNITTIAIAIISWKHSRTASVFLWPYIVWVSFATFLTWQIYTLNG